MTWKRSDSSQRLVRRRPREGGSAWTKADTSRRSALTKADIRRARTVALRPVLKDLGYQFTELRNGNYLVHHLAAEIVAKDHYWVSKDTGQAGNAIDFLVEVQGMAFTQSVELLLSYVATEPTTTTEI